MELGKMMEQAKKMMADMNQAKEDLANKSVEATSGGGMITVRCSGDQRLQSITIDPQVVDPEDVEMLQDLVLAAVNEGLRQAATMAEQELGKFTAGLKLPDLSSL